LDDNGLTEPILDWLESLVLLSTFSFDLNPNWILSFQLHEIEFRYTILGPTF